VRKAAKQQNKLNKKSTKQQKPTTKKGGLGTTTTPESHSCHDHKDVLRYDKTRGGYTRQIKNNTGQGRSKGARKGMGRPIWRSAVLETGGGVARYKCGRKTACRNQKKPGRDNGGLVNRGEINLAGDGGTP